MASCKHNQCLYIADWETSAIYRIRKNGGVTEWPINDKPRNISVTSKSNVLVTCVVLAEGRSPLWCHNARRAMSKASKLKEFTTNGMLLRTIDLEPDVVNPWHAIEMNTGQFVGSHGESSDQIRRVCLVDENGRTLKTYGGRKVSGVDELYLPCHLDVYKNGYILVVDHHGENVLMLDAQLAYKGDVMTSNEGLLYIWSLHWQAERNRLYIADGKYLKEFVIQ
jgi:hypothetical protein